MGAGEGAPGTLPGAAPTAPWIAVLALMFNALVWGTSWWPFRLLQEHGLHPLWATSFIYLLAAVALAAWRPRAVLDAARTPALWVLLIASGCTNAAFNWGVAIGDVVRVVLLFYLMPIWAALFARVLLGERLTGAAALRIALALVGAIVVLRPEGSGLLAVPWPRSLPDWLGVAGGITFALNNVMLKREAHRDEASRAVAMFCGGCVVSGALALALSSTVPLPPAPTLPWIAIALVLAALFMASNLALQHGAARLPANVTSVVMLSEVLFATVSSVMWGGGQLTLSTVVGGGLILAAALLSGLTSSPP